MEIQEARKMCKVIVQGRWEKPLEIQCVGLKAEQAKTCEEEINTLVNRPSLLNISDTDVEFVQKGRVIKALYEICGDSLLDIFDRMDRAFIECKGKYKNLATIISFSGQYGDEPIFSEICDYFAHCSDDKILTDIPTEFGEYVKEYKNFTCKTTIIIFAE
jgi:hypothetical protein